MHIIYTEQSLYDAVWCAALAVWYIWCAEMLNVEKRKLREKADFALESPDADRLPFVQQSDSSDVLLCGGCRRICIHVKCTTDDAICLGYVCARARQR